MVMFDANVILRYLLNDNAEMAETAERYLSTVPVRVTVEVVAEVVYVLSGVYSLPREKVANVVMGFLKLVCADEMEVLFLALAAYRERNLDFVDCVLYAYHVVHGLEVVTFDKKLAKLLASDDT